MRYPKDLFLALPLGITAGWLDHIAPTPLIAKMFVCLVVLWVFDSLTGIGAAIENEEKVCPSTFIRKFGWKLLQATAYLALGWVAGSLLTEGMKLSVGLSEPMAAVLGALIARDALSILRNLKRAGKNLPVIDKVFRKVIDSMNDLDGTHPVPSKKKPS